MLSLLAVSSCIYSFWYGVIPTSYFIFTLVSQIFLSRLSLDGSAQRDAIRSISRATRIYMYVFILLKEEEIQGINMGQKRREKECLC